MKITTDDRERMARMIAPLDTPETRDAYRAGDFPRADRVRDLDKRYRWDLLHASGFRTVDLYGYANDAHIDTALRAIVAPLGN